MKREHGIIQNALHWLEKLGRLTEVTDIIPGVIDVSHSSERGIVYKYETKTGCKILLKSNGSIQEVFVVTKNPASVQEWVIREFPTDSLPFVAQTSENNLQPLSRKKLPNVPRKSKGGPENKTTTNWGLNLTKKRLLGKSQKTALGNKDSLNVADRLDLSTLKALNHLKKSLEEIKIQDNQGTLKKNTFKNKQLRK